MQIIIIDYYLNADVATHDNYSRDLDLYLQTTVRAIDASRPLARSKLNIITSAMNLRELTKELSNAKVWANIVPYERRLDTLVPIEPEYPRCSSFVTK